MTDWLAYLLRPALLLDIRQMILFETRGKCLLGEEMYALTSRTIIIDVDNG